MELLQLFPQPPVELFRVPAGVPSTLETFDDVEHAADAVRDAWNLGQGAIPALTDTLDEHGLLVIASDLDAGGTFDGLAATVGVWPLVVVGAAWPGDRQRFTRAHERGHLVLHGRLAPHLDEEKACRRFAGAFLAPRRAVALELGSHRRHIEPRELHALKHAYGLSMAA